MTLSLNRSALSAIIGLSLSVSVSATTEADVDDDIIITASRLDFAKRDEVTSPVSLLTSSDINARSPLYLSSLLRSLPGLSVSQSGPAGALTQIRLRGSEANHVLVLIDGVKVSDPNSGEFDWAGLNAMNISRIEVLRGEQSALWGSDAVGGVINIITQNGVSHGNIGSESMQIRMEVGQFNTLAGALAARLNIGEVGLSINGEAFHTDGYDISGQNLGKDGSDRREINLGVDGVDIGAVTLHAKLSHAHQTSEFDSDTDFDGRLNETDEILKTDRMRGHIDAAFMTRDIRHHIQLSRSQTDTNNPRSSFRNQTQGRRDSLSWALKKNWGDKADSTSHGVTFLAETDNEEFSNQGGLNALQNQRRSIRNSALAGDYIFQKSEVLRGGDLFTFNLSARHDFNERFADITTWRVGTNYQFHRKGQLRASIGTGVKNPTMTEIFGYFPGQFIGNPDIKPETSFGYNIGYSQKVTGSHHISIDYFRSELEDEISTRFNPDFSSTVINLDQTSQREGVEIEARGEIGKRVGSDKGSPFLNYRMSATFLETDEQGQTEIRRPDFLASGTVTINPSRRLAITGSVDHTGSQYDMDFSTFSRVKLKAFTRVGLHAGWDMNDHLTLTLRGENLLNEEYQEVVGYASQDRSVYLGLRADF